MLYWTVKHKNSRTKGKRMAVLQSVLDNGLEVVLKPVRHVPIVSTWLWYRVGSRNEVEGLTGASHWVEHMMFKGSPSFPKGSIMRAVDRHGGYVNAMTSLDFTAYYATLPSAVADLALQIEADRMTGALFDPVEVAAERTVIISEREGAENEPRYVLSEEMSAAAFRVHPYHHQTIGWKEDLNAITRDELYAHYRQHYAPNNAVLVAVGDLDPEQWLKRIAELFGSIAAQELPRATARPEPPQRGERRVTVRLPGSTPLLRVSYHTPAVSQEDYLPLVIADAVLSGGKAMFSFEGAQARSSRLYRALVETELASAAGSSFHASLDPYLFTLGVTVREGKDPAAVEQAMLNEVARLRETPVSADELAVAIRQTQAHFSYSSETVTSQALTLGLLEIVDHHERMDTVLEELSRVRPDDVLRVAQAYLVPEESVVGVFLPTEDAPGADDDAPESPQALWPAGRETTAFLGGPLGPETVTRHVLDNGIVALVHENHASATVSVAGDLLPGALHEQPEQLGIASLTASMLRRGSTEHTHQEINQRLDGVGASLGFSSGRDGSGLDGRALSADVDLLLELLAEMLTRPSFPEVELNRLRGQVLTQIGLLHMDTEYRADSAFEEALYGATHPYGRSEIGTRRTITAISRDDIAAFHAQLYHPATLVLSIVGDVHTDRILHRLEVLLGGWRPQGPAPVWAVPGVPLPSRSIERHEQVPGKSQADLVLGVLGMVRYAADYFPAVVANTILGRLGLMGRLGDVVRDQQGLAYYASSHLQPERGEHPWYVYAGVNMSNLERAVRSIHGELERMRQELVAPEELADCQTYLVGALPLHLESNRGVAHFLLNLERYGLGLDYMVRYPDLVRSVTREQMREVMQRYWPPEQYVLAVAGTFGKP
jgi:zinc protease